MRRGTIVAIVSLTTGIGVGALAVLFVVWHARVQDAGEDRTPVRTHVRSPHGVAAVGSGVTVDEDLDELVRDLHLRPEQRERVRRILDDAQHELEKRLRDSDADALEHACDEVFRAADARVREALDPEQQKLFDAQLAEER